MAEHISPISESDFEELAALAQKEGGNRRLTPDYLKWWYLTNPVGNPVMLKLTLGDRIEGYATANQFPFRINGNLVKVAMPQNVLTSLRVRGHGWFGKLYLELERANERSGGREFLTFTNALSTPIFLEKFGYHRCADVALWCTWINPLHWIRKKTKVQEVSLNEVVWQDWYQPENGLMKTEVYCRWRYSFYSADELRILRMTDDQGAPAYALVKRHRFKGLPVWLLMELFFMEGADRQSLIRQVSRWVSGRLTVGLLHFSVPGEHPVSGSWLFRGRFNLLSKGIDDHIQMEWMWGDLDIV